MSAIAARRRRRTIAAFLTGFAVLISLPVLGWAAVSQIRSSKEGRDALAGLSPLVHLPSTPTALLAVLDERGRVASLAVFALAPPVDGVAKGGTVVIVPAGGDTFLPDSNRGRVAEAYRQGGLPALTSSVEGLLGITFDTSAALPASRLAPMFQGLGTIELNLDRAAITDPAGGGAPVEVFPTGPGSFDAAGIAQLLAADSSTESEIDRLPRFDALWRAVADRVGGGLVTGLGQVPTTAPAVGSGTAGLTPTTVGASIVGGGTTQAPSGLRSPATTVKAGATTLTASSTASTTPTPTTPTTAKPATTTAKAPTTTIGKSAKTTVPAAKPTTSVATRTSSASTTPRPVATTRPGKQTSSSTGTTSAEESAPSTLPGQDGSTELAAYFRELFAGRLQVHTLAAKLVTDPASNPDSADLLGLDAGEITLVFATIAPSSVSPPNPTISLYVRSSLGDPAATRAAVDQLILAGANVVLVTENPELPVPAVTTVAWVNPNDQTQAESFGAQLGTFVSQHSDLRIDGVDAIVTLGASYRDSRAAATTTSSTTVSTTG